MSVEGKVPATALQSYLRAIRRYPLLTRAEERRAAEGAFSRGEDEAVDRLVRGSLRLVVRLCRPYRGQGLPLEDLVNEGNLGLLEAVRSFDPEGGSRFLAFAVPRIRHAIRAALERQRPHAAVAEAGSRLDAEDGPEVRLLRAEVIDLIRRSVQRLDEPDRFVLMRRFGLEGGEPASMKRIAERLGVTHEMVRLIESRAKRRARQMIAACLFPRPGGPLLPFEPGRRLPVGEPQQGAVKRANRA